MTENEISYKIRGAIYNVYNELGPGLLESIYAEALLYELRKNGLNVREEVKTPVYYDGELLKKEYRLDILGQNKVIIELKSVSEIAKIHHKQILTYLRLTKLKLGILVNFNEEDINDGIYRKVNGL